MLNYFQNLQNGMPAPIHQDNFYWCVDGSNALTVWIALEDSGKKNGGIFYYDGTHKLGVLEHKPSCTWKFSDY